MKRNLISKGLLIVIGIILISCQDQEKNTNNIPEVESEIVNTNFDKEKESEIIRQVISKETRSFFERDYDEWSTYWIKEENAFRAGNGPDSTYVLYGWENISDYVENYDDSFYAENEKPKYSNPKRKKFDIKFNSDRSAYVKWNQYNLVEEENKYYLSRESRLMQKEDDQWKIINVISFWDRTTPINPFEIESQFKD